MTEPRPSSPTLLDELGSGAASTQDRHIEKRGGRPPGNVYLRAATSASGGRHLAAIARMMGLDQYSSSLLTRKVRIELPILGAILAGTFFYELIAWAFFFNGIFVGEMLEFHVFGTFAALLLALLFAMTILFFERQVITADSRRMKKSDRRWAQGIRLGAILLSGFIVAHPVDLLVFRVPVDEQLHRQAVAEEDSRLVEDLRGMVNADASPRRATIQQDLAQIGLDLSTLNARREQARGDQERFRLDTEQLQREAAVAQDALAAAEGRLHALGEGDEGRKGQVQSEFEAARRRYFQSASALQIARGNYSAAGAKLNDIDRQIETQTGRRESIAGVRSSLDHRSELVHQGYAALDERRRIWIDELLRSDSGDRREEWKGWDKASKEQIAVWPERWTRPLQFAEPARDFFEEIHTIYRLAFSWLNRPQGEEHISSSDQASPSFQRAPSMPLTYFFLWLAIHLAAIFIPFLVFAVKWFLMPKEVEAFFSAWHQALAGDPDARLMLAVEEKVRAQKELL